MSVYEDWSRMKNWKYLDLQYSSLYTCKGAELLYGNAKYSSWQIVLVYFSVTFSFFVQIGLLEKFYEAQTPSDVLDNLLEYFRLYTPAFIELLLYLIFHVQCFFKFRVQKMSIKLFGIFEKLWNVSDKVYYNKL